MIEWMYLFLVNDLTEATEGCCFLKTADRKRNKNRFFPYTFFRILKTSKALSVNFNSFIYSLIIPINSLRYGG